MATTEAIDVVMPQMGVSVSEGTITKWLKQEGEQVEADEAFEDLDAPVRRIAAADTPVPFAPQLERAFIPQVEDVVAAIEKLSAY